MSISGIGGNRPAAGMTAALGQKGVEGIAQGVRRSGKPEQIAKPAAAFASMAREIKSGLEKAGIGGRAAPPGFGKIPEPPYAPPRGAPPGGPGAGRAGLGDRAWKLERELTAGYKEQPAVAGYKEQPTVAGKPIPAAPPGADLDGKGGDVASGLGGLGGRSRAVGRMFDRIGSILGGLTEAMQRALPRD